MLKLKPTYFRVSMAEPSQAILALENGFLLKGKAFGASKTVVGEVVFNTSMTGYQEILTDPSYYQQIVMMTAPHIGNYGINSEDNESNSPKAAGLVIRELSRITSNWRSITSLDAYLKKAGIPGIEGIDTRALTKRIRDKGVLKACLTTQSNITPEKALQLAKEWKGFEGIDLVKKLTCEKIHEYISTPTLSSAFEHLQKSKRSKKIFHIVVFDFGAKRSIFDKLKIHGFKVTVVPADTSFETIQKLKPDGIVLSNGPGDPAALTYAHKTVAKLLPIFPTFGICMGHQVITHALGAKTYKLKFGHRGGNQPVKNTETGNVIITAQNHGYASDPSNFRNKDVVINEINLNDGTVSGLTHKSWPVFSVQYHPEAAPGPNDADFLFQKFRDIIEKNRKKAKPKARLKSKKSRR